MDHSTILAQKTKVLLIIPMQTWYTIVIAIGGFMSGLMQIVSRRHRKWWSGRRNQQIKFESDIKPIWIHCASLGEFEQGRPIIEKIHSDAPHIPIILTFFSPSGYEIRADYEFAAAVYYLPIDLPWTVQSFISKIEPRLAIFVKYEFWFNYLIHLQRRQIPTIFVSVLMKRDHFLFSKFLRSLTSVMTHLDQIFVQDAASKKYLTDHGFNNVSIAGDTRVDRVRKVSQQPKSFGWLDGYQAARRVIVYGSLWPSDLEHVGPYISENLAAGILHVIAPHHLDESWISEIERLTGPGRSLRLTRLDAVQQDLDVLIVDTMGDLAYIYRWAWLSYIGGGFEDGIHSILEPTAYLRPVTFGPKHHHFKEATQLLELGAAQRINNALEFRDAVAHFDVAKNYKVAVDGCEKFFAEHQGATSKIVHYLHQQKWLI